MTSMGRPNALHWVAAIAAALGRDPRTPEEALGVLGAFLRSDPAEKARFLEEAHAAWVRGGWAVRGDNTPTAGVVLAALEEATRRLAERYGWQRVEKARVRVPKEVLSLLRVAPRGVKLEGEGEGVFIVSPRFTEKAAWKAAYRLIRGEAVVLLPKAGEKDVLRARALVLEKVKTLLQKQEVEEVRLPWGETVRVLPGDRWEDLDAPEPRISAAIRGLGGIVREWEVQEEERFRDWEDELKYLSTWVHRDPEEPLPRYRSQVRSTWEIVVRGAAKMRPPTYGEVKGLLERPSWAAVRLLGVLVAYEVSVLGFSDPENAYQEGLMEALEIWGRLQRKYAQEVKEGKGFNPLLFLVPELRKFLLELRAQEVGVFRLSRADAQKLRKYFYLREREGLDPIEAGRKARLSQELLSALQAEDVSGDALVELGVEPREEVDYDTFLLRAKVKELKEEIARWWGPQGEAFVDALMEGQTPLGAQLEVGLSNEEAEEVLDFLRSELEGWVEEE